MKTNCYHHRNTKDVKTVGGMTHCKTYDQAATQARRGLSVQSTATGRLYFANKKGEEVRVYLSVHPDHTPDGAVLQAQLDKERDESLQTLRDSILGE